MFKEYDKVKVVFNSPEEGCGCGHNIRIGTEGVVQQIKFVSEQGCYGQDRECSMDEWDEMCRHPTHSILVRFGDGDAWWCLDTEIAHVLPSLFRKI